MGTTLRDVARRAGVSPAAVSLVLNKKPNRISEEKRALILQVAEELNYIPNQNAVGLVKGRSEMLGVVIPDMRNQFFSELVSGIDAAALENGWNIIITSSNDRSVLDLQNIRALAARDVEAILLVPAGDARAVSPNVYRNAISAFGRPVVLMDRSLPGTTASQVAINQRQGALLAMEHLISLGHRKIACILGPRSICAPRLLGVEDAFRAKGLTMNNTDLFPAAYTMESGYAAADAVLRGDYTAVFCFNDMMAYGFYKRARELGVSIPDDISVSGFDDIFFSDYLEVPLTTVWQPAYQLGKAAVRQAFFELEHPGEHAKLYLEPELKVRKSTAPIR